MNSISKTPAQRRNPLRPYLWTAALMVLLLPAVAMQFTDEVNWGIEDFAVMGLLLGLAIGAYELAAHWLPARRHRLVAGALILGAFLLTWGWLATAGV